MKKASVIIQELGQLRDQYKRVATKADDVSRKRATLAEALCISAEKVEPGVLEEIYSYYERIAIDTQDAIERLGRGASRQALSDDCFLSFAKNVIEHEKAGYKEVHPEIMPWQYRK